MTTSNIVTHTDPLPATLASQVDRFVASHRRASLYHTTRCVRFAADVFGLPCAWILAQEDSSRITGLLPLVMQRGIFFGRRWVSLPFFNVGGPLGLDDSIEHQLMLAAGELGRHSRVPVVEIRDTICRSGFMARTDKARLVLELPQTLDELGTRLGAKLRSQIRRADRERPVVLVGGAELVPDFFSVFSVTMRDLGTPVYPVRFFERLLGDLAGDCTIVLIRLGGRAAAAALLTHFRDTVEVPWAASLRSVRATSVNMRLYWECLAHAIARRAARFDFGRSTIDSGTYRFKLQWGAEPSALYWYYPLQQHGESPGPARERAIALMRGIWSRMPVVVANRLGAMVSPGLPW